MPRAADFRVVAPDPRAHAGAMLDLMTKAFGRAGCYHEDLRFARTCYLGNSHYDWGASRVGLLRGEVVTHYGVWGYGMRVGGATVRTAGIGGVTTHAEHRRKGLMAATAEACLAGLAGRGYDCSVLFGLEGFYDRFGYVRAWNEAAVTLDARALPEDRPRHALRQAAPARRDDLDRLYNRAFRGLTGTARRPTYRRSGPFGGERHVWSGARDAVAGYVLAERRERTLVCTEAVGEPADCLRALAHLARKGRCDEVRLETVPLHHPLVRHVRRGTCRIEHQYLRSGGAMIRTVNLQSFLTAIAGELSRRLARSPLAGWRGQLVIGDRRQSAALEIAGGRVGLAAPRDARHAVRGGAPLASLLIGTDDPLETAAAHGLRLRGEARRLLPVLFPAQHPNLSAWDRY